VTISFWDLSTTPAEIENLDKAYLKFNEIQQAAKVEISHGKDEEPVLAAVAAGNPPDVYWRWAVNSYGSWINKGVIKDLTPYTQASTLDMKRFVPIALETMKWQDKYYGMPLTSAGIGILFWNKPLFEKAGLDPEKPPTTLEELAELDKKLTAMDGAGNITLLGYDSHGGVIDTGALFKARFYDPAAQRITPTDPGVVAALEWWVARYQAHGGETLERFTAGMPEYYTEAQPLCTDKIAMLGGFEWDWLFMTTVAKCEPTKFGMAKMPRPASGPNNPTWGQGGIALVIPTGAAHPDEGWSFIEYLQGWEPTGIICAGLVNCAQVTDAVQYAPYRDNAVLKFATEQSNNVAAWPGYIPVAAEYATELGKAADLIIHGKTPVMDGLQQVYDQVQPALDKALGK
jgi:multiple sugar transport system substrate-binding protein